MDTSDPVGAFLTGIEDASLPEDIFCKDVVLDATVPNWRFQVEGADAVRDELGRWYADRGHFGEVRRHPIDEGELVEFTLSWEEAGVPHSCHQAHIVRLRDGRIANDTVFCGGRWPEPLLVQMAEPR
jgi:hypothetical protein